MSTEHQPVRFPDERAPGIQRSEPLTSGKTEPEADTAEDVKPEPEADTAEEVKTEPEADTAEEVVDLTDVPDF